MSRLSPRRRRAVGLGALALLVIAAAGFAYLRTASTPLSRPTARATYPASVERFGDIVTYNFVTPSIGWALEGTVSQTSNVGPYWVYKTVDAAKHWQKQLVGQSAALFESIGDFEMLDRNTGFVVVGNPLKLYRTVDGGAHWVVLALPIEAGQVTFSDQEHGWALTSGQLFTTSDAGKSWTSVQAPPSDHLYDAFRGASEGWAGARGTGNQPTVYSTQDGGGSWTTRNLPTPSGSNPGNLYSTSVELLPGAGVVATISYEQAMYQLTSFDKGATWTYTILPTAVAPGSYPSYGYLDALHWWAAASGSLYKSSDAGQTWTKTLSSIPSGLILLHVFDSKMAWARFSYSLGSGLTSTSDGGLHWTQAKVPIPEAG